MHLFTIVVIKKKCICSTIASIPSMSPSFSKRLNTPDQEQEYSLHVGLNHVRITYVVLTNLHFDFLSILVQIRYFFIFIRVRLFLSASN